jgi:poly(hydroxyalkanoate) depolymerase family esterase
MSHDFTGAMREAARLVQTGRLQDATQLIQAALGRRNPHPVPPQASGASTVDVIDVFAREVPCATPVDPSAAEPWQRGPATPAGDAPRNAGFHPGHYAGPAGQRPYKLFVPPNAAQRPLPLIVMLHGCTQEPDDFAAGTAMNEAAAEQGFYVLYPAQSSAASPQRCWNWFKHNHQARGRGEPAILAGMTQQVIDQYGIDASRVYVAGLSAGGAMAAILGQAYPDIFAAVGVHSGLAAQSATDLPSALAAMRGQVRGASPAPTGMPTIVFHGDADATVHPDNGARVIANSVLADTTVERQTVHEPGRRACTRISYRRPDGSTVAEHWIVHAGAHAWSGGRPRGSYTDARGPSATAAFLAFFFQHRGCHAGPVRDVQHDLATEAADGSRGCTSDGDNPA